MGMIYFAGVLDNGLGQVISLGSRLGQENPVCIRGYDETGNHLSKIHCDNPIPIVDIEFVPAPDYPSTDHRYHFYFHAKDKAGNPVLAYKSRTPSQSGNGALVPWIVSIPKRIVATRDGEVYGFYEVLDNIYPGQALVDGTWQPVFVDPFRIYTRDGYRMPAPEIIAEPTCFDADADGNIYIGGFSRNPNGGAAYEIFTVFDGGAYYPGAGLNAVGTGIHVLRKYNRAGDLLWAIPGNYDVYTRTLIGGVWYQDRDENAIDGITSMVWDSTGFLYVAGITFYIPQATPNGPATGDRWPLCFGSMIRVRKIDPDDGSVIWDEFFSDTDINDSSGGNINGGLMANLLIDNDILYLTFSPHIFKIDLDGNVLADGPTGENSNPEYPNFALVYADGSYIQDGKLYVGTAYFSGSNPLNLQVFSLTDLSLIERRATTQYNWRRIVFKDVVYIGRRTPYGFGGSSSAGWWHYTTADAGGAPVWTGPNVGAPGLHGRVAGDRDGVQVENGGPWSDQYSVFDPTLGQSITYRQFHDFYLRYTDEVGRTVGPDWDRAGSSSATVAFSQGGWIARDISAVDNTAIPATGLPIALGLPTFLGDLYVDAPPLSLNVWLGLPFWRREYVGPLAPTIYRVTVGGLELALISLTARYTAEALTIQVIAGFTGLEQADAILAAEGETLTVRRGPRFPDGSEQLEILLEAPLTASRLDEGANSTRLSLTAAQPSPPLVYRIRTLAGVTWIGDGQARAAVDAFLRPGDTALIDGESWPVGALEYTISASDAVMRVERA